MNYLQNEFQNKSKWRFIIFIFLACLIFIVPLNAQTEKVLENATVLIQVRKICRCRECFATASCHRTE